MTYMQNLDDYYRGQSSHDWYHAEIDSLHAEAVERGVTIRQVAAERQEAALAYRQSEAERTAEIVDNPGLLRQLKRFWNRGLTGDWGLRNPLDPPPTPNPSASRTGAPSSGRSISPPRQSIPPGWRR